MRYKPHEYTCISRWGQRLGSFPYYIRAQQELAAKDRAPITAIYKMQNGEWAVAEDITSAHIRRLVLGPLYDADKHGQYFPGLDVTEDRWDRLPRVCASYRITTEKLDPILLTRGESGFTILPKDFDVPRFNKQRNIRARQVAAMHNGSMFGWSVPASDPNQIEDAEAADFVEIVGGV